MTATLVALVAAAAALAAGAAAPVWAKALSPLPATSRQASGKEREMPVSKNVLDMIATHLGDRKTGYVFQTGNATAIGLRNASRLLDSVLEDAEIKRPGLGWHSFRRYRATALAKAGVPEAHRLQWMGHADVDVDNGYVDTAEESFQRQMVEKASTDLSQIYHKLETAPIPK